jgi:hypothetical protein
LAFLAISGASISLSTTVPWDISSRLTILNMFRLHFGLDGIKMTKLAKRVIVSESVAEIKPKRLLFRPAGC